jgi:hypothetical protein
MNESYCQMLWIVAHRGRGATYLEAHPNTHTVGHQGAGIRLIARQTLASFVLQLSVQYRTHSIFDERGALSRPPHSLSKRHASSLGIVFSRCVLPCLSPVAGFSAGLWGNIPHTTGNRRARKLTGSAFLSWPRQMPDGSVSLSLSPCAEDRRLDPRGLANFVAFGSGSRPPDSTPPWVCSSPGFGCSCRARRPSNRAVTSGSSTRAAGRPIRSPSFPSSQ